MGRLFGTDGVRGIANTELTPVLAYKIGRAAAYVLTKEKKHVPHILIGTDTRISKDMLEASIISGICSVGAHAVCAGIIPTPAVARLVREHNMDAGIVISASHNPMEYNGVKIFNESGYKLSDQLEDEIESYMNRDDMIPLPSGEGLGKKYSLETALDDYMAFLKSTVPIKLDGLKVAIDCANGSAYEVAPLTLFDLGAAVSVIHHEPDGRNINLDCGSTHMESLAKFVLENGADVGIAFDGDADRCLAVDELGNIVDGDQIMAICALHLKEKGLLKENTVVATVMSNLGFYIMAKEKGLQVTQTDVGDRYVLEKMREKEYTLGGEQSGHVIFLEYSTTGDGLLTALQLLSIMKETGKSLSSLASVMNVLPQVMVNAKVANDKKYSFMANEEINQAIRQIESKYEGRGRVLIRASGTEPLVRVMIEGEDLNLLTQEAQYLAGVIEKKLI